MAAKKENIKHQQQIIDDLNRQGIRLLSEDLKSAYQLGLQASALATDTHYDVGIANSAILLSSCYSLEGQYVKAIETVNIALIIGNTLDDLFIQSAALHTLGNIYSKLGNLENALSSYLKGLEYSRSINGEYTMNLLNNISVIYSKMYLFDQSLAFLKDALNLSERKPNAFYGFLHANIAEVYLKMNQLQDAETYASRAHTILSAYQDNSHYWIQYYKVSAKIYSQKKAYDLALEMLEKGSALCKFLGEQYRLCSITMEKGRLYFDAGNLEKAECELTLAAEIAQTLSAEVELRDIAQLLSNVYEQQRNYLMAFKLLKTYQTQFEKINTQSLKMQLLNKTIAFEIEQAKKDAEIERLRHEETRRIADAQALKSALLAETLKDIETIGKMGQLITASLNMNTILKLVYKHIKKMMQVDVIGICLFDPEQNAVEYKLMIAQGKRKPLQSVSINDESSLAAKCIRERRLVSEPNLKNAKRRSVIYVPLLVQEKAIGALTIQSDESYAFSERSTQMIVALSSYIAIAIKNSMQSEALESKTNALEILSITDELTGLYNRRYMMDKLIKEHTQGTFQEQTFGLALIDIDHFKAINDHHGHNCGDAVLAMFSNHLKKNLRDDDILARWGGEEFLLLMPDVTICEAQEIAQRLCTLVSQKKFMYRRKPVPFTITIGVSHSSSKVDIDSLIHQADEALYRGKENGRNRVTVYASDFVNH